MMDFVFVAAIVGFFAVTAGWCGFAPRSSGGGGHELGLLAERHRRVS